MTKCPPRPLPVVQFVDPEKPVYNQYLIQVNCAKVRLNQLNEDIMRVITSYPEITRTQSTKKVYKLLPSVLRKIQIEILTIKETL